MRARFGYLLSREWKQVKCFSWGQMIEELPQQQWTEGEKALLELLSEIEGQMLNIIKRHFDKAPQRESTADEDPISRVASLSQVFFNCTFFIVQSS